jgi:MoxR-like ATPase
VLQKDLRLAVEVALATDRPLLLRGEPGSGKSTLAPYIARNLGWRYYEHVVTSRTKATDILWTFDHIRKLADASSMAAAEIKDADYVEPGVLWWAIDPGSAQVRGHEAPNKPTRPVVDPSAKLNGTRAKLDAVVLLDEIDKADPDVPNALLGPLGTMHFTVAETGVEVPSQSQDHADRTGHVLVVITTNNERDLPPAFLRRCIVYRLPPPDRDFLLIVGRRHSIADKELASGKNPTVLNTAADLVMSARREAHNQARRPPSTAEFLDVLMASTRLGITPDSAEWDALTRLILVKDEAADEEFGEAGVPWMGDQS